MNFIDRYQSLPVSKPGFLDLETGCGWFPGITWRPLHDGSGLHYVHSNFFGTVWAVTDDFGNLVRVPS